MNTQNQFLSSPAGVALIMTPLAERQDYIKWLYSLPLATFQMLNSGNTAAFIRGLVKDFNIDVTYTPAIAFLVLQTAVGKLELAKLGSTLSAELKLANDKAQSIAKEIEKELFTPVMMELNQWLEKQKKVSPPITGARNVVDLKHSSQRER